MLLVEFIVGGRPSVFVVVDGRVVADTAVDFFWVEAGERRLVWRALFLIGGGFI